MFVVIQFPVVDGRGFAGQSGAVGPDWQAPSISNFLAGRDFVRGFGRLAYRRRETSAEWIDENVFAYARRAVRLPVLQRRHFSGDGAEWMVSCRFRRLFGDGEATWRLEIGFDVTPSYGSTLDADAVVRRLLALPAVVPGIDEPVVLVRLGPYVARRYAQGSTRHGAQPPIALVAAGEPVVVVDLTDWGLRAPDESIDAGPGADQYGKVSLATTRTPFGAIETWYLDGLGRDAGRNVRLAILRQHAQEETLDRVLRLAATGAVEYVPQTPPGDRFERFVNDAVRIVNRDNYRGVDCARLRVALDEATSTKRPAVEARRRDRLDGMRRQVRAKAEQFLAEREARRPTFNVSGKVVHVGDQIFSGQFYGPVAGTVYAEKMENSFNAFAATKPDDDLRQRIAELHEQIADLVGRLAKDTPEEADEVADTLTSFTEEAAKPKPNKVSLRALGNGLVEVAKKVAELATPVATAVGAVLKIFS